MESVLGMPNASPETYERWKVSTVENWMATCRNFFKWERQEVMLKDPTPATEAAHRRSLEYLRTGTDHLIGLLSEPSASDAEALSDLAFMKQLLQDSWEYFNNPMTEEEADAILAKAFPG